MRKMGDFKKNDVFFQIPGLILWIIILIVSFGDLKHPIYAVNTPMKITGIIILLGALIFRVYAATTLNKSYSYTLEIKEGHQLVTSGLYKYIRHPIYTSSLRGFLVTILAIPLFMYRIGNEERMLIEEYGEEYEEYQEHTWKLFPFTYFHRMECTPSRCMGKVSKYAPGIPRIPCRTPR